MSMQQAKQLSQYTQLVGYRKGCVHSAPLPTKPPRHEHLVTKVFCARAT